MAGSALHDLQSVKTTVDSLAEQMLNTPYVMVLLVNNPNIKPNTSSRPNDPTMVSSQKHTYHVILFLGTSGYEGGWLTSLKRNDFSIFLPRRVPLKQAAPETRKG